MMLIVDMKSLQAKRNGKKSNSLHVRKKRWFCIHVVHKGHQTYILAQGIVYLRSAAYRFVEHTNREPEQAHERLCMYVNENCEMQMTIIIMTEGRFMCGNNFNFMFMLQRQRGYALSEFTNGWVRGGYSKKKTFLFISEPFYS